MKNYIETNLSGMGIMVEVSSAEDSFSEMRGSGARKIDFDTILNDVKKAAKSVIDSLCEIDVEEISLEYGIKLGVKAGVAFWAISEVSSDANFTIKLKWKRGLQ